MYDLHTHTYYSDGVLGFSELVRRCEVQGYRGLVISDHCDRANVTAMVKRVRQYCEANVDCWDDISVLPGCELTHVPPQRIKELVGMARKAGADVVIVHGETPVEPVAAGTNRAAIEAGVDVLAHPGLITHEEARLAADKGVMLEISGRHGHSFTNGHVASIAQKSGTKLSFGSDGHAPGDYPTREKVQLILRGAGLSEVQAKDVMNNNQRIFAEQTK
ncbi:MAG: histidinol phosphate phosphatase domain-containing protein [Planctomycetota bacterium]